MKNTSLRIRLMMAFIVIFALFGGLSAGVSWFETKEKIDEFFDTYQIALARQLSSVDWADLDDDSQSRTNRLVKNIQNADDEDEALGFAVFTRDGQKVFHDNENGKNFYYGGYIGGFMTQTVEDEQWRIVWIFSADEKYIIAVGQELKYRNDVIWDTLEEFIAPWIGGLLLAMLIMLGIISREFRPLRRLSTDLQNRSASDLSPVTSDGLPAEIEPLVKAFNRHLAQIDSMIRRERGFIANASHELRTPLAGLKIQLEVARMDGIEEAARNEALDNLEQGLARAAHLVEQLLILSRLESSVFQNKLNHEKIDWQILAEPLFYEYQKKMQQKSVRLSSDINAQGPVAEGDMLLCSLLLRNLLDNALKYSPDRADINITVTPEKLTVSNSGISLSPETLSRLSERFFRPAGQAEQGSGLGLSIVRFIADYYGCSLHFSNQNNIFTAEVVKL